MSQKKSKPINPLLGLFNAPLAIWKFIKEAREELKKVSWPSRQITIRYTGIVIVSSLVVGLVIGGIDYLLTLALEAVI